ncbi:MAG: hypothetical protein IAB93_05495 [Bacteroidetes bacterium]|uniref:Uncharacterized protein n=1 Tax=Candidatus Merdivivens pullistercoris TaxID=2840873 RepID=A0A9D9I3T2_9BACT|nr:hypothetical protein [Candidatus Merdivivens pullistercoris]
MKHILITLVLSLSIYSLSLAQDNNTTITGQDNPNATYRLYPTTNVWTFLKLNTQDGRIWQVQYDVKDNNRFEVYLNLTPLAFGSEKKNGRFTLYPTQNIWTFILLDTINGKTWQVQWSQESEKRFIIPIL